MSLNPRIHYWQGRRVWLVGASSGMGRASASLLHARGPRATVSARSAAALDDFVALHPGSTALALDVTDPANLTGSAITWPEQHHMKPARRAESVIVLDHGMPVLFAVPKSHRIVSFTDDERILQPACTELAYALQHQSKGSVSFAEMNGESLKERNEYRRLLHAAGFVDSPQGMKLYG